MYGLAAPPMNNPLGVIRVVLRLAGRVVCICAAAAGIAIVPWLWLGPPSSARQYRRDEIARFSPAAGNGIVQLAGKSLLLGGIVYASRRWPRIRL